MAKKEDRLLESAKLYLKLGNFKQYCEIMIQLEQFEKALVFAPAVSMEFW
jgi:hypothetical protein